MSRESARTGNRNFVLVLALLAAAAWGGCTASESKKSDDSAPADTTAPSALTSVLNTVPAPLARQLELTTNESTTVTFTVTDGIASWTRSDTTLASSHTLAVLGMKPGTDYTLTATITDAAGNDTTLPGIDFTTDVLPTAFPLIVKNMVDNSAAEPGVILFDVQPFNQTGGSSLNLVAHQFLVFG